MSALLYAIVMAIGACMVQDGICSILYYPKEAPLNHIARIMRTSAGVILIVIAIIALEGL